MKREMKLTRRITLTILLISMLGTTETYASYYDFSAVCETGQVLYYNIIDEINHYVELTCPFQYDWGVYSGPTGNIIIPERVVKEGYFNNESYTVTKIGTHAFMDCTGITSLTIPGSVTTIGFVSFKGCTGITSLTIPNSVTTIGDGAFLWTGWYNNQPDGLLYLDGCCLGFKGAEPSGTLQIAEGTRLIADCAFENCTGITGSLVIPNSVTTIGAGSFEDCTGITSLTIPNSVTTIGASAFEFCTGITSLTIPNSVTTIYRSAFVGTRWYNNQPDGLLYLDGCCLGYKGAEPSGTLQIAEGTRLIANQAFKNCTGITGSLVIPNSVTTIGDWAFMGCTGFTGSLVIPNSVTTIGERAFEGCTGFTGSLTIGSSVTTIGERAFCNCYRFTSLTIPNSVTTISGGCFYDTSITGSLTIPNSVTTIGRAAFERCTGFTGSLTIPNSVTTIGERAFYDCHGFTGSLTIPNSVTTIGRAAFENCTGFTSLTIPGSVTTIGERTFAFCTGFTGSLTIPNSVTTIGDGAFMATGFTGSLVIPNSVITIGRTAFDGCTGFIGDLVIPNSVTTIGDWAFMGCTGFTGSLVIPNSVTTIGERAFEGCTGFTSLTIPNSVTTIGTATFEGCTGFTSLTIPNSVTTIGSSSFKNCTGITSLTIPNSVTTIGASAFENCTGITSLTIPNSVTTIGASAFENCRGILGSLTIPNSVTSVGNHAFEGCTGIHGELTLSESLLSVSPAFGSTEINAIIYNAINCTEMGTPDNPVFSGVLTIKHIQIGPNVESIPDFAFKPCYQVEDMFVASRVPPVISFNTFETVFRSIPVTVPYGSGDAYRNAPYWSEFYNIIEGSPDLHYVHLDNSSFNGGSVNVSINSANVGEEIQLTVTPQAGMKLSSLIVCNANDPSQTVSVYPIGKGSSTYGFIMPSFDVMVKAVFVVGNGVDENGHFVVSVYPNPTNNVVKIEAENIHQITITNLLGQVVYIGSADGNEIEYDFSGKESGIYLVSVETDRGVIVKKVLVSR